MTQNESTSEIIDIDPETVIEHKPEPVNNKPEPKNSRFRTAGLIGALMLGAAILGGWLYRDILAGYLPSDQLQNMAVRIDAIETNNKLNSKKLDAVVGLTDELKSQLGAAQSAAEDARKQAAAVKLDTAGGQAKIAALEKSLGAANATLDDLKQHLGSTNVATGSPDVSALTTQISQLEKDMAGLKQAGVAKKLDTTQLSQSLADLTAKIAAGAGFVDEVQSVKTLIPAAEGLDVLAASADKGVVSDADLAQGLKVIAQHLKTPDAAPVVKDDSWWGRTTNLFSGLVTIKNAGTPNWSQLAEKASGLAANGHLADALGLLEQNLESLPQPLQDWRMMANRRLAVDRALDQVNHAVSREIAARG